MEKARTNSSK